MVAIVVTLAGLLALLIGVLTIPVVFVIDAERRETLSAQWRVSWLFGLFTVRGPNRRPASATPASETRREHASTNGRKRMRRVGLAILRTRGFVRRVVRLAFSLFRKVEVERLRVHAAFGFEDPADTGFVYGCVWPVLAFAGARGLDIQCMPMFLERGVKGVIGATIRTRPLSVLGTIMGFVLSPPVVRAIGAAWRARK